MHEKIIKLVYERNPIRKYATGVKREEKIFAVCDERSESAIGALR